MAELPSCFSNVPFMHEHSIERRALDRLARLCGQRSAPTFPIDVGELIEIVEGLPVEHVATSFFDEPEPERILGAYCFAKRTIYINHETIGAETRERWTLAHEYGHHVLHAACYLQGDLFDQAPKDSLKVHRGKVDPSNRMEWQANQFAAHLLLPRELTLAEVEALLADDDGVLLRRPVPHEHRAAVGAVEQLRKSAEVSRGAARIRLEELGAITATPRLPRPF